MSTLLTTEVMGSTPGRHLEITGVTDSKKKKKNPGGGPNVYNKKCCNETSFNILPNLSKNEDHTQMKSSKQLTSKLVATELTADGCRNLFAPSTFPTQRKKKSITRTSLKNGLHHQSACECFRLQ